jgi:hypothetical protein
MPEALNCVEGCRQKIADFVNGKNEKVKGPK